MEDKKITFRSLFDKRFLILFAANVILMLPLLIYGGRNFSIDSYGLLVWGYEIHTNNFLSAFRYFGALVFRLLMLTGHNPVLNSTPDVCAAIVIVAFSVSALVSAFLRALGKKDFFTAAALDLGAVLIVENRFLLDVMSFPECVFLTAVGVFFCFAAVIVYMTKRGIGWTILTSVLLICAMATYQQLLSVYIILVVAYLGTVTVRNAEKGFLKNLVPYLKAAALTVVSGAVYFAVGKVIISFFGLTENERIALSPSGIFDNVVYFLLNQKSFLRGRMLFIDHRIMLVLWLAMGLLWLVGLLVFVIKEKKIGVAALLAFSYAVAYAASYLPGIVSTSHGVRTMFALFTCFAALTVGVLSLTQKRVGRVLTVLTMLVLAATLAVNLEASFRAEKAQKAANAADVEYVAAVVDSIQEHEATTGTKISSIIIENDSSRGLEGGSAFYWSYSAKSILCYELKLRGVTGVSVYFAEEEDEYFTEEFDTLDLDRQIVYDGTTARVCVY
ncbi:MAG: glucosyltransferase domain-containing protein [Clostridia bacterium]|nr:glucosyltransferase domain-containing protein [Clostridia bacterium]